jgi:hypothetical protein
MAVLPRVSLVALLALLLPGCWQTSSQSLSDGDTETGGDADGDSDGDTDIDSDSDGDTDGDGDTDSWPDPDTAPDGYGEIVEMCWTTVVNGTGGSSVIDLVALSDGSSVLAGRFGETVTFDPGGSLETSLLEENGSAFLASFGQGGEFRWVRQLAVEHIDDIAVDGSDRIAVLGRYFGEAVLSAGEADEQILDGIGELDLFLALYEADGAIDWARQDGGEEDVRPTGLGVLSNGLYVVVGSFNSETTFGVGEEHETTIDTGAGTTLFIAAYQEDGAVFWVRTDCDNGCRAGRDVATHPTDGVFMLTGSYMYEATFGMGGPNETTLAAADYGASDEFQDMCGVFFAAYDLMGDLVWVESAGSNAAFPSTFGTALSNGSFIASGSYYGNLYFEYGEPDGVCLNAPVLQEGSTVEFQHGMFAARLDEGGELAWAKGSENTYDNTAAGVRAVPLDGDTFVIPGGFRGAVNFGLGDPAETWLVTWADSEPYGAVYDENGGLVWVARMGDNWTSGSAEAAAGLGDGNFLLAGSFFGSVDFLVGPDEWETVGAGALGSIFLAKACPQF